MPGFRQQAKGFATKAIHVGQDPEQWNDLAVVPPLVFATTFKQHAPAEPKVSTLFAVSCNFGADVVNLIYFGRLRLEFCCVARI